MIICLVKGRFGLGCKQGSGEGVTVSDDKKNLSDFDDELFDNEDKQDDEDFIEEDLDDDLDLFDGDELDRSVRNDENLPIVLKDREARKPREKELELPVLPLSGNSSVFPYMVIPLFVGRSLSLKAIEVAMESNREILLVTSETCYDR